MHAQTKVWRGWLLVLGMVLMPAFSKADYRPTEYGGSFGIGLELGDPGSWGIDGKVWIDRRNAFQGAVKFPSDQAILQLDYLWHDFDLIHIKGQGEWPFYIGVGGDLSLDTPVAIAARMPIGVSYIFDKKNVPVDLYLQLVPTLWFYSDRAHLDLYPEFGAHFYL